MKAIHDPTITMVQWFVTEWAISGRMSVFDQMHHCRLPSGVVSL
jgi:hypothetical protein